MLDSSSNQGAVVDLWALPIETLESIRKRTQEELSIFESSTEALASVLSDLSSSSETLTDTKNCENSNDIFIPCTTSMYMKGHLTDVDRVMIDIGTGYFAEVSIDHAIDFFNRKTAFVKEQIDKIQPLMKDREILLTTITEVMNKKAQQTDASQSEVKNVNGQMSKMKL